MGNKSDKRLPPDPKEMNDQRAWWAGTALTEFRRLTRTDAEDAVSEAIFWRI
jgi:hypothetical protein